MKQIAESIQRVTSVIRESVKNGEKLVALKERVMKSNAREQIRFEVLKNGNGAARGQKV